MSKFLDFLRLRDPQQATPLQRGARRLYLLLAVLLVAGLVLMVFVAGIGALVDAAHFSAHRRLSYPLMLIPALMLVAGLVGRIGFFPLLLTGITLVILTFQFPFIYAFAGSGRALHVANALLLFWLALLLMQQGQRLLAETRAVQPGVLARSLPGILVFVLSVLLMGVYVIVFPAGQAVRSLPVDATGADIYAAACASCHAADGTGGHGPSLVGNSQLADIDHVIEVITEGVGAMPPQELLSSEQVERVAAFVQDSWHN